MTLAKQFDFQVTGRGTLGDTTLPLTAANLALTADIVTINGVSVKVASLDSTALSNLQSAMETIINTLNHLTMTIGLASASVANTETVTITADGITVTYTNSSGAAVAGTGGALATAIKGVLDADAKFAARFSTAVSGTDLVITQIPPQSKIDLAVVGGTGITAPDAVTVV